MAEEEKDAMTGDEKQAQTEAEDTEVKADDAETQSDYNVSIEDAGPCRKKISIEIPADKIKEATDEQYNQLRRDAIVPGFRKGRAPRRLLEKRFGKEASEQVKLKLLIDASEAALKDKELDTIGEPDFDHEKIELPEEGPLQFEFEVEVRPEFELPELEGIEVTRTKHEITDEQVDREIEQMQRLAGVWTPRKKGEAAEEDDQVVADVTLRVEGGEADEGEKESKAEQEAKGEEEATSEQEQGGPRQEHFEDTSIYVRHNGFVASIPVENLDEILTGAKAGETKSATVEVPKTYFKEEYRGKQVELKMEIKDVKWLKPGELDEALFQRVGVENEEELRERIQDQLQGQIEQQSRSEMSEQIYKHLLENTDFDLPTSIVAEQAGSILQRQFTNLMMRGLSREQIEEQMEKLRASSEEQAKDQLKTFFIMDKVADKLDIEVSEEEINGHIAQLAIQQQQRPEKMREQMERNGSLGQFRLEVRTDKCIAKLLESAKITEVEPEKKAKKGKKSKKKAAKKESKSEKKTSKKSKSSSKKKTDG